VIGSGAIGCIVAGLLADRTGRTVVASAAMAISGPCCLAIGFLYGRSEYALLAIAIRSSGARAWSPTRRSSPRALRSSAIRATSALR